MPDDDQGSYQDAPETVDVAGAAAAAAGVNIQGAPAQQAPDQTPKAGNYLITGLQSQREVYMLYRTLTHDSRRNCSLRVTAVNLHNLKLALVMPKSSLTNSVPGGMKRRRLLYWAALSKQSGSRYQCN
jgi:hypothetical protein